MGAFRVSRRSVSGVFLALALTIVSAGPAGADDPTTVPETADAAPVITTKPVQVPQSGKFFIPVTISNAGARLTFPVATTLTIDGVAPFRGLVFQPFSLLDPSGGGYSSVFQLGVSSVGAGHEVRFDPPVTVALPIPTGADPTAYQPVFIDAPERPGFRLGKVEGVNITFSVDRLKDGLNRYALSKAAKPDVPTLLLAPAAVQRGYHSLWAGQSKSMDLAPGQLVDVAVKLLNTGTDTWTHDTATEVRLGSSAPLDNTRDFDSGIVISPIVGKTRFASHLEGRVQPGETGTFLVRLRAPLQIGTSRVFVRPVADGVTWMEDQGIFVDLSVK